METSTKRIQIERLIAAALAFVGFAEQGGNNKGQVVERFLKKTGLPGGYAWCAAFVHHVGFYSQFDEDTRKSRWPLPATAGCKELYNSAESRKMLTATPERGDLFLMYVPSEQRLAHTGIILSARRLPDGRYDCQCVEGNTNAAGSREGDAVLIKPRTFNPNNGAKSDRFIRWRDLA